MSEKPLVLSRIVTDCLVADKAVNQTFSIGSILKGQRVLDVQAQCLIASDSSTDSTWWCGDAGDTDGLLQSFDTEQTVGAWIGITTAAYMLTSGGKLYNADTTINAYYTQGSTDGNTAPKIRVVVLVGTPPAP